MAKLKAPLMSLGASGAIGEAVVFFGWKGLNVAREYVIPANPKTTAQNTQRGYLKSMVTYIHTVMATAGVWDSRDTMAYALWGSTYPTPRTWFNQVCKHGMEQLRKGLTGFCFSEQRTTAGSTKLDVQVRFTYASVTGATFFYGTSKTALVNSKVADSYDGGLIKCAITALTKDVKYYWQMVGTAPAGAVGAKSGIGYGVPLA